MKYQYGWKDYTMAITIRSDSLVGRNLIINGRLAVICDMHDNRMTHERSYLIRWVESWTVHPVPLTEDDVFGIAPRLKYEMGYEIRDPDWAAPKSECIACGNLFKGSGHLCNRCAWRRT